MFGWGGGVGHKTLVERLALLFVVCAISCFLFILGHESHEMPKARIVCGDRQGVWLRRMPCTAKPSFGEQNPWVWTRALRMEEMTLCSTFSLVM